MGNFPIGKYCCMVQMSIHRHLIWMNEKRKIDHQHNRINATKMKREREKKKKTNEEVGHKSEIEKTKQQQYIKNSKFFHI